jgi:membrane-associated phospholipid phosphatase
MSIVVLLADPAGTRMPRSLRVVLSLVALASAGGVALGLVAAHMHYFTDTVAGAAVGTTVALSTALIIDWVVARRASQKLAEPQPVELARLR